MTATAPVPELQRAGAVLMLVGIADIAVMVFCLVKGISYSSSFNLFAVIAGVFLLRGSLRAASFVRWFFVLMLAAMGAMILAWPLLQPLDLTLTQAKLGGWWFLGQVGLTAAIAALLWWLQRLLGSAAVLAARDAAGRKRRDMRIPAGLGAGGVAVLALALPLMLGGESGKKAEALALEQVGAGYQFHVSHIQKRWTSQGTFVNCLVTAWNAQTVRQVPVQWKE